MEIFVSIKNGVITNRTVGEDLTAELSVPEGSVPTQIGWITADGGQTFSPPPPEAENE